MGCGASTQERRWEATALVRRMSDGTTGDKCPEPAPRAVRRRLNRMVLRARIKDFFNNYEDTPPERSHGDTLNHHTAERICDWVVALPRKTSMVSVATQRHSPRSTSSYNSEEEGFYDEPEELVPATDLTTSSGSLYAPRRLNDARQISRLQFLLRQKELSAGKEVPQQPQPLQLNTPPSPVASFKPRFSRTPSSNIFPQVGRRAVSTASQSTSDHSSTFIRRTSYSSGLGDTFQRPDRVHRMAHATLSKVSSSSNLEAPLADLRDL